MASDEDSSGMLSRVNSKSATTVRSENGYAMSVRCYRLQYVPSVDCPGKRLLNL